MARVKNRMNTGGALVILVILVVAMSVFAVLALKSSINEKNLVLKSEESIKKYYELDKRAEYIRADIDLALKDGSLQDKLPKIFEVTEFKMDGDKVSLIKYRVEDGNKNLNVTLSIDGNNTKVEKWSTKTDTDDLVYELLITD